ELEHVFFRAWLLAVHVSELATAGAFSVFEIAGESILITRAADGGLRAFYNVCQHRGTRLCTIERGRAEAMTCPYHHWSYGLYGRLLRAAGAGAAGRGADLRPLACAERFGFVWISMAEQPVDIDDYLAPVAPELARYRPHEYRLATENVVEVAANWKASVDVNNESYHLATLHPMLLAAAELHAAHHQPRGDHSVFSLPLGQPASDFDPDAPLTDPLRGLLEMLEVDGSGIARIGDLRPAVARSYRARADALGVDLSQLSDQQ